MRFYLAKRVDGPPKLLTRKDEAQKIDKDAELIDIPVDQEGLRVAMQEFFNRVFELEQQIHDASAPASTVEPEPVEIGSHNTASARPEGYAEKSTRFEDEFNYMPLATQLHYATIALENARNKL